MISLYGLFLSSQLIVAVADQVPQFDFMPSCRAGAVNAMSTLDSCVKDEQSARDQLVKDWAQFPTSETTRCTQETEHFAPSYVELYECLDMYRYLQTMPNEPATTNGKL